MEDFVAKTGVLFFLALLTLEEQYDLIILKRYACVGVGDNWSNSCKLSELTVSCQWQFSGLENIPWLYRRWLLRKLGEGYIESVLFFNFLWVLNCFQKNYLRNKSNVILIAMTTSSGKRVPQRPWPWAPPFKGKIVLALQAQPHPWPSAILSLPDAWRRLLEPASELGVRESFTAGLRVDGDTLLGSRKPTYKGPPPPPVNGRLCVLGFGTEDKWNWSHKLWNSSASK